MKLELRSNEYKFWYFYHVIKQKVLFNYKESEIECIDNEEILEKNKFEYYSKTNVLEKMMFIN